MQPLSRLASITTATTLALGSLLALSAPASAEDTTAAQLLTRLQVASESGATYDRTLFPHWIDADGDGCDTRQTVLYIESTVEPTVTGDCEVSGEWYSYVDGATWTDPSAVDIDHLVPLNEAWQSGAHAWSTDQRRDFANDLDLDESLGAMTDTVNSSKGARGPEEWLPPLPEARCEYAVSWTLVKFRWSLSVDAAERAALGSLLSGGCGEVTVTVPTVAVTPQPSDPSRLGADQTLVAGAALTSTDSRYRAVMQTDGNFVVYSTTRALWSSRTDGNPGARTVMQGDGNLVVYSSGGAPLFFTRTDGSPGARLVMQTDGNLVVYSADDRPLWNIGAEAVSPPPPPPVSGSTLQPGQSLTGDMALTSPNGRFRVVMQGDGNLVAYAGGVAYFNARTDGNPGARLVMQGDGNAVVYSSGGAVLLNAGTNGNPGARMVVQDDGNLVVYAGSRPLWNIGAYTPPTAPPPPVVPVPPSPGPACEPAYPDFCIPTGRDLDCPDVRALPGFRPGFTVRPPDPFRLDGSDGDGRGCE